MYVYVFMQYALICDNFDKLTAELRAPLKSQHINEWNLRSAESIDTHANANIIYR